MPGIIIVMYCFSIPFVALYPELLPLSDSRHAWARVMLAGIPTLDISFIARSANVFTYSSLVIFDLPWPFTGPYRTNPSKIQINLFIWFRSIFIIHFTLKDIPKMILVKIGI